MNGLNYIIAYYLQMDPQYSNEIVAPGKHLGGGTTYKYRPYNV